MRCNVPKQPGARKVSNIALIKNKRKIAKVGETGMLYDKLEARYNQATDPQEKAELKAQMDLAEKKIATMSAEINAECFIDSKKSKRGEESGTDAAEEKETAKEVDIQ